MTSDPASQIRETAEEYALNELYPDRDEADTVGMEPSDNGVCVGVKIHGSGLFSGAKYATVTVNEDHDVVLANKHGGNKNKLDRQLGRAPPQQPTRQTPPQSGDPAEALDDMKEFWDASSRLLFGDPSNADHTKPPSKCPKCGTSRVSYAFHLWKKVNDGTYNCRNCGKTVRLDADTTHHHDHDFLDFL